MAKQFLTKAAAEKWSPEDGAKIYSGSPTVNGDKVTLNALLIGTLNRIGATRLETPGYMLTSS